MNTIEMDPSPLQSSYLNHFKQLHGIRSRLLLQYLLISHFVHLKKPKIALKLNHGSQIGSQGPKLLMSLKILNLLLDFSLRAILKKFLIFAHFLPPIFIRMIVIKKEECSKKSPGSMLLLIYTYSGPCDNHHCENGGTCTEIAGKAKCVCTWRWAGDHCETGLSI